MPSRTPADGGFVHARTINADHTRATYNVDLRDPCRLMNWNRRHGLRRCCKRYGKGKSDPLGHCFFSNVNASSDFPSRLAGSACHFPSGLAGSACRLARSSLYHRHSCSPLLGDSRVNALLFADFAVAHGKSITFWNLSTRTPQGRTKSERSRCGSCIRQSPTADMSAGD